MEGGYETHCVHPLSGTSHLISHVLGTLWSSLEKRNSTECAELTQSRIGPGISFKTQWCLGEADSFVFLCQKRLGKGWEKVRKRSGKGPGIWHK